MSNTKVEDLERLHKLYVAGSITETEFKILKEEIIGEVADVIDDKVYKSVKIGEQEWMVENLNVEHFRNGDIIPEVKTNDEWLKAGEENLPAWCYNENNISNGQKYGKLYNWHAVNDPRGLAPEGWYIPTDTEFTELTDYLVADGHSEDEGWTLKSTSGWDYGSNGTDDYGWNGLPGSLCYGDGGFDTVGQEGYWWSSSQDGENWAFWRCLYYDDPGMGRNSYDKSYGFSVRCLRD